MEPTNLLAFLAALVGVLIREAMAVSSRRNSLPPSFAYYWALPKNRWNLAVNGLCAFGLMLAYPEVVALLREAGLVQVDRPVLTGLGIGLLGAFIVRWFITMVDQRFGRSRKAREADTAAQP